MGGAVVADERGAPPQRERGSEYLVVLVSDAFDEIPWLERVYVAGSLWDGHEMGAPAEDFTGYTRAEFARKSSSMPAVHGAVWQGIDLLSEGWSKPVISRRSRSSARSAAGHGPRSAREP